MGLSKVETDFGKKLVNADEIETMKKKQNDDIYVVIYPEWNGLECID